MKNNFKTIIILIIVIAIISIFTYFLIKDKEQIVAENPFVAVEDSLLGCYVAHLQKDIYTLVIQSENEGSVFGMLAYNNYQKDSSSGSFSGVFIDGILWGNYFFDSEGMHSERQVIFKKVGDSFIQGFGPVEIIDNKELFKIDEITFDSNSIFIKDNDCLEQFTDVNNVFSFDYHPFFKSIPEFEIPTMDWSLNAKQKGILLTSVIIPKTYLLNTNFSSTRFTVGRATDPNAIKSCTTINLTNGEVNDGTLAISGYLFTKFISKDVGAGNFYETTSYRGILDGDCYAIEYTIHSTNIENYSPDQGIKEFDKSVIQKEVEKIIKSFKFFISSD